MKEGAFAQWSAGAGTSTSDARVPFCDQSANWRTLPDAVSSLPETVGPLQWEPPMITEDQVRNALKAIKYPGYSRDIVSFGLVKQVSVAEKAVGVTLALTSANPEAARQLKTEAEQVLKALPGIERV